MKTTFPFGALAGFSLMAAASAAGAAEHAQVAK